jgi:serine/threonine protein kinase
MIGSIVKNRFYIVKRLGAGTFGETFLAEDRDKMNAQCVVKRLITPNYPAHIDIVRQMFDKEANKLNALDHQGIPKLIAYFEDGRQFYLVHAG